MPWYDRTPKSIDVEELVKRCITDYADSRRLNVYDDKRNKYCVVKYNQTFVEELSKSLVKNVFGVVFSQLTTNQDSKGSKNNPDNDFVSKLDRIDKTVYNGLTYEDKHAGKHYYSLPAIINKQSDMNDTLNSVLNELTRLAQIQETTIREKNAIIQKQHDSLLRYDNDLLYKTKIPMLREVIDIADQIKQIADDQEEKADFPKLLEDIHALGDWVDATLQTESVRKFEFSKNSTSKFDPKYQEIVETQYTSKKEDDGLYKTMLPGYFWTIPMVGSSTQGPTDNSPRSFEFVLRHEQVVRLKYKPNSPIVVIGESNSSIAPIHEQIKDSASETSPKTNNVEDILQQKSVIETSRDKEDLKKGADYSGQQEAIVFNREIIEDGYSAGQSIMIRDISETPTKEDPSQARGKSDRSGRSKKK